MTTVAEVVERNVEPWQQRAVVRVALAGCGVVGSALLREFVSRRASLADRLGVELVLASVLVRDVERPRDAAFDRGLLTDDVDEFLRADADVVIEAIGGLHPAHRIATSTLSRGRKLVTANKALLAQHGSALVALARCNNTTLRYDAAVGGGVPILRLLDDALGSGSPTRVRGILNGTANYVLTRLEGGATFEAALHDARHAGFAEADASRDLDGRDAADKIALVAWTTFGVAPEAVVVQRRSLCPDPSRYSSLAARLGLTIRQVADCALVDGAVVATVEPLLVSSHSALARTKHEQNWIEVDTGWNAPLTASGPGAGGLPTANSLLADLVAAAGVPARRSNLQAAIVDTRRSSWAIEIAGAPSHLHAAVHSCGLVRTDALAAHAWTLVHDATRAEIDAALSALDASGTEPIAVRIDGETVSVLALEDVL
ncbi:MAG: homoserine dehydrogenase [bacterium]